MEDVAHSGETEAIEVAADPIVAAITIVVPIIITVTTLKEIKIIIQQILIQIQNLTKKDQGPLQMSQMTRAAGTGRTGRLRLIVVILLTAAGRTTLLLVEPEK